MSAEDRMKLAIEAVDQGDYLAPAAASRMKGTPPKKASNATKRRFSDPEELVIKEYGFHMCDLGHPPTLQMVTDAASTIERGKPELSQVGASVGKHWAQRFLVRHNDLAYKLSSAMDSKRAIQGTPEICNQFIAKLRNVVDFYQIKPADIWKYG
ncbi:hypothetical protein LTR72_012336 [Exophiala xenobiotica]|nr:hypothetical protein LTR72_012336 [Exophiala xenobiotica]